MIDLLIGGAWKYVAMGAVILACLWAARKSGADDQSRKQIKANLDAALDQLEMHREADQIERDNAALNEAEARRKAAAELGLAAHGAPLTSYVPQRSALALISTGDRHAIASRGPFVVEGDWVWRWKDRIDRRFMAKYVAPAPPSDRRAAPPRAPG